METEQLKQLLKEHVKQQKTTTGISNLLQEVFREAVQEMLKAEMDNHLGYKEILGMWLCVNESASFWITVLTDLKESWCRRYTYHQHR